MARLENSTVRAVSIKMDEPSRWTVALVHGTNTQGERFLEVALYYNDKDRSNQSAVLAGDDYTFALKALGLESKL